jgi:hypothetical protein
VNTSGEYTVTVLTAETYFTASSARVFSISIGGVTVATNLDLVAEYGTRAAANISHTLNITNSVNIRFTGSIDNPRCVATWHE